MTGKEQSGNAQSVTLVEADIFDRMNESDALIAQRAYEIYQSRGGVHGFHEDDWFRAEHEVISTFPVESVVTAGEVRLTAQVPGFDAKDLEVEVGHRRAIFCGIHTDPNRPADSRRKDRRIMRIVDLPFDVDPVSAKATLLTGTLQVVLPRSR